MVSKEFDDPENFWFRRKKGVLIVKNLLIKIYIYRHMILKYKISHGLWSENIYIQRVVWLLSPSQDMGIVETFISSVLFLLSNIE